MDKIEKYGLLIATTLHLETRHIFKSCNIYLKPERFCKSKFMLSKKKKNVNFDLQKLQVLNIYYNFSIYALFLNKLFLVVHNAFITFGVS